MTPSDRDILERAVVGIAVLMAAVWIVTSVGSLDRSESSLVGGPGETMSSPMPSPESAGGAPVGSGASCLAFIAGLDSPDIGVFGSTEFQAGVRRRQFREIFEWTRSITRIIDCTADHGALEGADAALEQHAAAMELAYAHFHMKPMKRTARAAMKAITDAYPSSCYVPVARKYLRTGTIDVSLIQPCL
jgi:hypothetical protein